MRGKPLLGKRRIGLTRIIPAHAGQTTMSWCITIIPTDHPRACGANIGTEMMRALGNGSSPRMRGKPDCGGHIGRDNRIIPAHAGQTTELTSLKSTVSDHPRACGANFGS